VPCAGSAGKPILAMGMALERARPKEPGGAIAGGLSAPPWPLPVYNRLLLLSLVIIAEVTPSVRKGQPGEEHLGEKGPPGEGAFLVGLPRPARRNVFRAPLRPGPT